MKKMFTNFSDEGKTVQDTVSDMNDGSPKKLQYALGHKTQYMIDEYVSIYEKELNEEFNDITPLSMQKNILETKKKIRI